MKRKTIATFVIATLIAMTVFVGPAAADGNAWIWAQKSMYGSPTDEFDTANNVYGRGFLGDESQPNTTLCPGPTGCGGRVYVVNYSDTWTNGTLLNDTSGG